MHTILGAGGPTANALTKELLKNGETIRLVSRKPVAVQGNHISWVKADLLHQAEVLDATRGASVIYLCAGLIYDKDIWKIQWPIIIQNVINAAKESGARLIFFDNIYMYGLVKGPITETTPYNPCSVKGEIRAKIATQLMDEVKAGNLTASIARGADFYGADSKNSFFDLMVLDRFAKKQSAQWVGDVNKLHNFTYIPDAGQALYLLGQNADSDNQIWHMPTAPAIKGIEFLQIAAKIYEVKLKYIRINKLMLQIFGLFHKVTAGTVEMYYQYDHDYNFDSTKFEKAFKFKTTSYTDGIRYLSETMYKK